MSTHPSFAFVLAQLSEERSADQDCLAARPVSIYGVFVPETRGQFGTSTESMAAYAWALQATGKESATPISLEESVRGELELTEELSPVQIERLRRRFAFRYHPDRACGLPTAEALERMKIGNRIIDDALYRARSRVASLAC